MLPSELTGNGLLVALDTETSGIFADDGARVSVVSMAVIGSAEGDAWAWPYDQGIRDKQAKAELPLFEDPNLGEAEWVALLAWLGQQRLVFHNAKFDLHMLAAGTRMWGGVDLSGCLAWDTMLAQRVLDPLCPVGLKTTATRLKLEGGGERGREDVLKQWMREAKQKRYDLAPWDVIGPYALQDAVLTRALYEHQIERLEAGEASRAWIDLETELCKVLYKVERRGIGFDAGGCLDAAGQVAERMAEMAAELPFRASLPAAKRFFFEESGRIPNETTPSGAPKLDDEILRRLISDGAQWAPEYAEYRKLESALGKWYRAFPAMVGGDGRLRTSFRQTKVVSGRMSVERVQLQAVPKNDKALAGIPNVRSLFVAREGCELWNLDLQQAELRVAARYARCERMLAMLAEGADLHGVTCAEVLGIGPGDADFKVKRDIAKRLTFSSIFQVGARRFQELMAHDADVRLPLSECERIVGGWRALYPEYGRAHRRAERAVTSRGWVRTLPNTPYERPSWFADDEFAHKGWSRMVQGSLAEFLKLWLVVIEREWPGCLVLTVHDSVVLETPAGDDSVAQSVAVLGSRMAGELFRIDMPIEVSPWE